MVGLVVPSTDENLLRDTGTAAQSPFVIAATRAGIKVVPSIINAVVLTSAWSAANSGRFPSFIQALLCPYANGPSLKVSLEALGFSMAWLVRATLPEYSSDLTGWASLTLESYSSPSSYA